MGRTSQKVYCNYEDVPIIYAKRSLARAALSTGGMRRLYKTGLISVSVSSYYTPRKKSLSEQKLGTREFNRRKHTAEAQAAANAPFDGKMPRGGWKGKGKKKRYSVTHPKPSPAMSSEGYRESFDM